MEPGGELGEAAHRIHELVPGVRWYLEQKGDRGPISIFSCELDVSVMLLVFLRDGPQSVLLGYCIAKLLSPKKVWSSQFDTGLEFSQLRNKKQNETSQMLPFPQQCFSEVKCL